MNKNFEQILKTRISKISKDKKIFLFPSNKIASEIFNYCKNEGYTVDYLSEKNIDSCSTLILCEDRNKVNYLNELSKMNWQNRRVEVILAGRGHQDLSQLEAKEIENKYNLDSHAVGYSHTKAHILESIKYLVNQKMTGWVVELGTFRAGTLALIEKIFEEFKYRNRVQIAGFDTWGVSPERTFLDIFYMPEWVSTQKDFETAESQVSKDVVLCKGDIAKTFAEWSKGVHEQIIFAFIDNDNFTPTSQALPILWDKLAIGGIIIFDHLCTYEEFYDTVGEHVAAVNFFKDRKDFYHLSETGVYMKVKNV